MLSWRLPGRQHFTPRFLIAAAFFIILTSVFLFANSSPRFTSYNHRPSSSTTSSPPSAIIDNDAPVSACFVVLVRNSELGGIASTIRQIEQRFNAKHKYPYVFLNDDDFTQEFVDTTSALTEAETQYGKLDQQMWGYPSFINQTFAAEQRDELARMGIPYASSESYRHMCRYVFVYLSLCVEGVLDLLQPI